VYGDTERGQLRASLRGAGKHLHDRRGVTVEEMRQMSMAIMRLVPTEPVAAQKVGTSVGMGVVRTGTRMRNDLQRPRVSHRPA
jgi:hypothetical protein